MGETCFCFLMPGRLLDEAEDLLVTFLLCLASLGLLSPTVIV